MKKLTLVLVVACMSNLLNAQLSCSGLITQTFNYTGTTQDWTVPGDVTSIIIKTRGGSGGVAPSVSNTAGGGAIMEATYTVAPGTTVRVLVGGAGVNGNDNEAGGGGATAVYVGGVLYIVAGGGGGEDNTGNGGNGLVSNNGGSTAGDNVGACSSSPNNGIGGTAGAGGNHGEFNTPGCIHGGGGGGGLNSAGQGNGSTNAGQPGGQGNINGANGGAGSADDASGINGGWGWAGGGGADDRESGGGGGYSGGGGGPESFNPGGGGSYLRPGSTASFTSNGTGVTSSLNGIVQICYFSVLPVNLVAFTGVKQTGKNLLRWTTSEESDLLKFRLERSVDNITYNSIGEIAATNNNRGYSYEFIDAGIASNSRYFYRLFMLNANGTGKYSKEIMLNSLTAQGKLSLYPNPVRGQLVIGSSSMLSKVEIIDMSGRLIYSSDKISLAGPVQTRTWKPGTYIIKAYTGTGIITDKFIKL